MTEKKLKKTDETTLETSENVTEEKVKKPRAKKAEGETKETKTAKTTKKVADENSETVEEKTEKKSSKKEADTEKTETSETPKEENSKIEVKKSSEKSEKVSDTKNIEAEETNEDEDPNAITFAKLGIKGKILENLIEHKIITPTPIQAGVIPFALEGKHIVGQSNTGTGKTASFVLPLLQNIDPKKRAVQALIIAPTRELANQIREDVYNYSSNIGTRSLAVYGNSNIFKQREILQRGVQVVVGTPGRLIDLIDRRYMRVDQVQTIVLDEVDKMLDMGFIDDIKYLLETVPHQQLMTFSATITPEINSIIEQFTGNEYEFVKTSTDVNIDKLNHSYMAVHHTEKFDKLKKYLDEHKDKKVIIFTQTKINTQNLLDKLLDDGYDVGALHGDMHQRDRFNTIKDMKSGDLRTLIATDVASRGLNLNDIALVINYDVPQDPESYVHRIGRTARAGAEGEAIMFVSPSEFNSVRAIERTNKIKIKEIDEHGKEIIKKLVERATRGGDRYGRNGGGRGGYGRNGGRGYDRGGRNGGGNRYGRDGGRDFGSRGGFGDRNERSSERTDRGERSERSFDSNNSRGETNRSYDKFSSTRSGERTGYYAQNNDRNSDRGARNERSGGERSYERNSGSRNSNFDRNERSSERTDRGNSRNSDRVETGNYQRKDNRSRSRYARRDGN